MAEAIRPEMPVFLHDGEVAIGAVRHAPHGSHTDLIVFVEGGGDFLVHPGAVKDVHHDKLVLDPAKLDPRMRAAIARAHLSEDDDDHDEVDADE